MIDRLFGAKSGTASMRRSVIAVFCCAVLLGVAYYSYYRGSEERHRQNLINEIDGMANAWKGLEARSQKLAVRAAASKANLSDSDRQAKLRINEESIVLRGRFLAFENRLKVKNNGALPKWLEDDPNWQQLDRVYSRQRN